MSGKDKPDEDFCWKLPKVELHAHINGSIEKETIEKLLTKKKEKDPNWKLPQHLHVEHGDVKSLEEIFALFKLAHELCDNEEAAYVITSDVIKDFAQDNVKYLELRTTPRNEPETGMTKQSYVESIIKAIQDKEDSLDITVRLLLSVDRRGSVEYAWDTLKLADDLRKQHDGIIVGLDLSGDPAKGDATSFLPVFQSAREKGLKLSLHLAELKGYNEECLEMLKIPPDRIGHGTFLHPSRGGSEEILDILKKNRVPFEMCLTSNVCGRTCPSYVEHHFKLWYDSGHPVTVNTDDKGVFSTSLSKEYCVLADTFGLSRSDVWNLSYNSIEHIFADDSVKAFLKQKWEVTKKELFLECSASS